MKRIVTFTIVLMALSACATPHIEATPDTVATGIPQVNMPNPASVYCKENGNKLVLAADGSQTGLCIFPDGSACEEWAYFRGECCPAAQACPTPPMKVEGSGGSRPTEPASTQEQAAGGYMAPGTAEEIAGWSGIIKSTEPGAQYDDYFERQDLGQPILFGIDAMDPAVQSQIKALRDSGTLVRVYGTLLSNVPDYNGSQIQVTRIQVGE